MSWTLPAKTTLNSSLSAQILSDVLTMEGDISRHNLRNLNLQKISPWRVFYVSYKCLFPVLCLLSVAVNVLTIKVLKQLGFKHFNNIITSSMAVSDLFCPITNLVAVIADIVRDFDVVWHCYLLLARIVCINHWKYRAWYFSIHLTALLGVEMVLTICFPSISPRVFRPINMKYIIFSLLVFVSLFSMPDLYLYYDYHFNYLSNVVKTTPSILSLMFYTQVYTAQPVVKIVVVIFPLAVIFVCSVILYFSLPLCYSNVHRNHEILYLRKDGFKPMFVMFVMKFVMLLPFSVLLLFPYLAPKKFTFSSEMHKFLEYILNIFSVLFSSTNFFVHFSLNEKFSTTCKQAILLRLSA